MNLDHGGNLNAASLRFNIPLSQWLDLSTGVSPLHYPLEEFPETVFTRLPYPDNALLHAACAFYAVPHCLPVPGSQAIIETLPSLLADLPVLLPDVGYQEHHKSWQTAGRSCDYYPAWCKKQAAAYIDACFEQNSQRHLLIINPNNPTGMQFSPEQLLHWSSRLSGGGRMIVDEAFIDPLPGASILNGALPDNVIVLRSFGKFFGLPGLRLGFVMGNTGLLQALEKKIPLWSINGPAQWIATQALADWHWQQQARETLQACSVFARELYMPLMQSLQVENSVYTRLFSSFLLSERHAQHLYQEMAEQGVLLRYIPVAGHRVVIRIGQVLPSSTEAVVLNRVFQRI